MDRPLVPAEIVEAIMRAKDGTPSQYMTSLFEEDDYTGVTDFTSEELKVDPGKRLLHLAELGETDAVIEVLKQWPEAIHARDNDGYTAMHRACYNDHLNTIKVLLQKDSELIRARTADGWTPLHSAARWGNTDCVEYLLSQGADINAETRGKLTPLHLAASNREQHSCLEFLLGCPNIDTSVRNKQGDTAYDIAKRSGIRHAKLFEEPASAASGDKEAAKMDQDANGKTEDAAPPTAVNENVAETMPRPESSGEVVPQSETSDCKMDES